MPGSLQTLFRHQTSPSLPTNTGLRLRLLGRAPRGCRSKAESGTSLPGAGRGVLGSSVMGKLQVEEKFSVETQK